MRIKSAPSTQILRHAFLLIRSGQLQSAKRQLEYLRTIRPQYLTGRICGGIVRTSLRLCAFAQRQVECDLENSSNVSNAHLLVRSLLYQEDWKKAFDFSAKVVNNGFKSFSVVEAMALSGVNLCLYKETWEGLKTVQQARSLTAIEYMCVGRCAHKLGRYEEALSAYEKSIQVSGKSIDSYLLKFELLFELGDNDATLEFARQIEKTFPKMAFPKCLVGQALLCQGAATEAIKETREALERCQYDALVLGSCASTFVATGDMATAAEVSQLSLEIKPEQGLAFYIFSKSKKIADKSDPLLRQMLSLSDARLLSSDETSLLEYSLGKALEDLKCFPESIEHYALANLASYKSKFGDVAHNASSGHKVFSEAVEDFKRTSECVEAGVNRQSPTPIIIVGMMRSGTTLMEQILSAHGQVSPGGEMRFWPLNRTRAKLPGSERGYSSDHVRELAREYLEVLRKFGSQSRFVTDKMPTNYVNLGLIHLAFPSAKIIHMQRNPVDTCFSIYTTYNRSRIAWAHEKASIAAHFREYRKIMGFWSEALPAGKLLHMSYEKLVRNPEHEIRRVLDFCDLPFESACLSPESNERVVLTPSLWQVRKPINASSVNRAMHFLPWLTDFVDLSHD